MRCALHTSLRALALCAGLLPRLAGADTAPAPAGPPPAPPTEAPQEPLTSPGPQPPPESPVHGEAIESPLDTGHEAVSRGLFWMVERFDRFFADEREVDLPRAASFFRWRSDLRLREDGTAAAGTNLRAEVRLPAFNRRLERLRLTLIASTVDPPDPHYRGSRAPDGVNRASAGLRLALHDSIRATLDTQLGLLAHWPPGGFARLRLRQVHPLGWSLVARDALVGFWQTNTGWGTRQDASLERPLARELLARLDATGTVTQRTRGWEWEANASLLAALGQRTAAALVGRGAGRLGPRPGGGALPAPGPLPPRRPAALDPGGGAAGGRVAPPARPPRRSGRPPSSSGSSSSSTPRPWPRAPTPGR